MSQSGHRIEAVTRTIYGTRLQTCRNLGIPFIPPANTTLNERFDVRAADNPSTGQYPILQYMAIGNRGHLTVTSEDGSDETEPRQHRTTDAALFGHIPFVLRPYGDDLTALQRANYALRVGEVHGGQNYWAYYLRRLDLTGVSAQLLRLVTDADGNTTSSVFTPTTDNLNPEPPAIQQSGVVIGSDTVMSSSAILQVQFTESDIAEILNAHEIRTGSQRSPVISEIALCSGLDKTVQGQVDSGPSVFNYEEAVAVQCDTFISTYHSIAHAAGGAVFNIDVGYTEPLLSEA